jgi:glutaredoxin
MLAGMEQKTKTCPYCGSHVNLLRAKRVASAENAFEASEKLKELKAQKGFSQKPT